MMKLTKCFLAIGLATAFSACDMFEYHPYDLDVSGPTDINRTNIGIIERSLQGKNEFSFAVISDTQRWYDETEDAVKAINNRNDIDFVLHTGDLSDFGAKLEMVKQRDILNKLKVPYVCILGNHDCVATGELLFNKIFGPNNFAFSAGNIRFICLNTNALEFDYSEAVPDFGFISDQIANFPETAQKTIVAMHAGPYSEQFQQQHRPGFPSLHPTLPTTPILRLRSRTLGVCRRLLRRRDNLLPMRLRKKKDFPTFQNSQRQL